MYNRLFSKTYSAPRIRELAVVSLTVFAFLTLVSLLALMGGSAALHDAMETVSRDVRSEALASEIEAAMLMHQRLSNLHVITGEAEIDAERDALVARIRRMLQRGGDLVGAEQEQRILDDIASRFDEYLQAREQAEGQGLELVDVMQSARGSLSAVLADLRALGELNDAQVERARAESLRVDRWATWVGASAAALLIAGFAAIAWGVRRYVVRPVVALHEAMDRFRNGDLDARADSGGVREVDELARMFDDMAASLAQQRKAQLTFLAGVAHDLKSPLSTLKTGLYALEYEQAELRRGRTRAVLDRQVDLLSRMVDDLLDATRIEAGQLELRRTEFDLRALINDVVRLYAPTAPDHRMTARLPPEAVRIRADGLRIEQVVRNLVSNAIKYSPCGGPVEVAVECRTGEVVLSVSDRGTGIPREDLQSIFLPFRRRKLNVAPGAGLGLSVVRRIVAAHDGRIDVDSEPGKGSTFRVTLPVE
jgi:signal transduction histidine kinase